MSTFHGYVHVPFCRVRCGYCDFNTYTASELDGYPQSAFIANLENEVALALQEVGRRELETVFFGGGTPTLLPAQELVSALQLLGTNFGISPFSEITTEANPDTVDVAYLETLRDGGFNRISFGMQSAVPEVLAILERTHNPENVPSAVKLAQALDFQTSVDLIYGAPGETMGQWKQSVEAALALGTDHISAYALIVEPATKLARQIAKGELPEPDDDLSAEKYEWLESKLLSAGFEWYELSNWSKSPETASKHNLAYWQGMDWWGFGPGAHSHIAGKRWSNAKHPTTYAKHLANGQLPIVESETITQNAALEERAMLELRLSTGLEAEVVKKLNPDAAQAISEMIAAGLVDGAKALQGSIRLTVQGRLLADFVLRKLLGL